MKKHLKRWLPLVLAVALLAGLIPVSGFAFAAEDRVVARPNGYFIVNAAGTDYVVNDNQSNSCELGGLDFSAASDDAKLAFWFDTTAIAYDTSKGDKNNYSFYLDVDTKSSSDWQGVGTGDTVQTRVMSRDGQIIEDAGQISGEEPSWIFTLPSNTVGYMMISMNNFKVNELEGFRLRPEWNWNDNADNQTIKIRDIGFVADPAAVLLPDNYNVINADGTDYVVNDNQSNSCELGGLDFSAAADDAKLAFWFDTTAIAYDTSKGDKNNYSFYLDVDTKSSSDWQGVGTGDTVQTRVMLRDGQIIEDAGQIAGEEPSWIFTLPANAVGYMMISMNNFKVNELEGFRLRPEWNWNDNADNQTIKIRKIGYVAEPAGPVEETVAAPEGFVLINTTVLEHAINDGNQNEFVFENAGPAEAPKGSKLAFYFDTTSVTYDTSKGDKNNYAVYMNVWSNSANDWVALKTGGNYSYTRTYLRDGLLIEDVATAGSDPVGWIVSVPTGAKGWMIFNTGDIVLSDITAFKFSPEWGWNSNLYNKTVKFGNVGYIAPEATIDPPEGFVSINTTIVDHGINSGNTNEAVFEGIGSAAAPKGSKLVFYFDTTAVAYDTSKGDKNNWAVKLNVWSNSANAWVEAKANGKYAYTRLYLRDGQVIEDTRTAGADPDNGWIASVPTGAKGWMIFDMGDIVLSDITAFKLSPEWGWNDNLYSKIVKIGNAGYIAPEVTIDPPEGFVSVNTTVSDYVINASNSNELVYEGAGAANAPAGSKLVFYFDTTAVAYDTSKGDKNNYAAYLRVWSNSANGWVDVKADGKYAYTRLYVRDGQVIEDTRTAGADPDNGWIASIPVGAKGWMIFETGDIVLSDITAFKFSPEWNWNDNLDDKTVKFGNVGYIPGETPEVSEPESSEEESSAPEVSEEESSDPEISEEESSAPEVSKEESTADESIMDPPEGFVLLDKNGVNHVVNHEPNGNSNTVSAYLNGISAPSAPIGSKLVFYFDTTAVARDSSLGDKDNWAVYIDVLPNDAADASDANWQTLAFPADGSAITRIICRDGETITVEGRDGDPSFLFAVPTDATGYMIIDMGQIDLNTIQAIRLRPEWNWNPQLYGKTIKIRNIGYLPGDGTRPEPEVSEPDTPVVDPDDFPFVPEPSETPDYYGTNYVVTNPDLQELKIDDSMKNDLVLDLSSNLNAPAGAKAIVFRYNTTGIPETRTDYTDRGTHGSYWSVMVGDTAISGNINGAGDNYKYVQHNQVYYWRDQVMENSGYLTWLNTLPVNGIGYVIINIDDLQPYAQNYLQKNITVADVTSLVMKQEWFWNSDMFNQTIRITDVGYLMDPAAFIAAYKDSFVADYLKGPMNDDGDVTVKADSVEGTFAELSWNAYEGANRYFINVYDENGNYLLTERTRKTNLTLEGLAVSTAYKVQILATGDGDAVLSASNVLEITTLAEDLEAYMKDILEYDPSMTATDVTVSGDKVTIKWDWLSGVGYYTVHLYEQDGDVLTFVSRTVADDGTGEVTLSGLEKGKTYVAQIVCYDVTDSIIYAYAPTDAFVAVNGVEGGDNSKPDNEGNPNTGVGTCAGVLALAALLSGGVLTVTRKRRV